ncbi:C40 family peptidase [Dermatophilaceae bacterium Soc4.6]
MTATDHHRRRVRVEVANLWERPDSPRTVDAPSVADEPDVARWLEELDAHDGESMTGDGRLGLHHRLHTQLLAGEPAVVLGADPAHPGWVHVRAPRQPTSIAPDGYRGWVRASHLTDPADPADPAGSLPLTEPTPISAEHPLVVLARQHLGLPYLWGGLSPAGFDCSGLVHWCLRALGVVVPRDADDQQDACVPVPLDEVRAGDLYFFALPGEGRAHHVGIVTSRGHMIHAPETGCGLMEEPLDDGRLETLAGAGRPPS